MVKVVSAANSSFLPLASLLKESAVRWGISLVVDEVPSSFSRPASWYKIQVLQKELALHPFVLWVDADCVFKGPLVFPENFWSSWEGQTTFLGVCQDVNGMNCGVMWWRSCPEALSFLQKVWEQEQDIHHSWWEQQSIRRLIRRNQYEWLPKYKYNAYAEDVCSDTIIRHFPGESFESRLFKMKKEVENGNK